MDHIWKCYEGSIDLVVLVNNVLLQMTFHVNKLKYHILFTNETSRCNFHSFNLQINALYSLHVKLSPTFTLIYITWPPPNLIREWIKIMSLYSTIEIYEFLAQNLIRTSKDAWQVIWRKKFLDKKKKTQPRTKANEAWPRTEKVDTAVEGGNVSLHCRQLAHE